MDADQIDYNWEGILLDGKLPEDVMVSILSNLPVKSLLRFKAVCKSWRSFISSPLFVRMHLHRQSIIANNLVITCLEDTAFTTVSPNYNTTRRFDFDDMISAEFFCNFDKQLVGSCKGLVCVKLTDSWDDNVVFVLWNPATRRYRSIEIPKKDGDMGFRVIGLGYVEATNDYKIVGLGRAYGNKYLIVYTLSSDSWKEADYESYRLPNAGFPPTFLNRCMHWLSWSNQECGDVDCRCSGDVKMFAFDVEDEVMCCFDVPYNYGGPYTILLKEPLVIRGCLSIATEEMVEKVIEIWVMVEYGVEGSWVKQFTLQGLTTMQMAPFISWKDGKILFTYMEGCKLMFYDPCSKKMIFLEDGFPFTYSLQVLNYVESLASVMGGRNVSLQ